MEPYKKGTRFCAYQLWCPECGLRSASWIDDPGKNRMPVKKQFERQFDEVTFPSHLEHGTFTIIDELRGGTYEDLKTFFRNEMRDESKAKQTA